MGMDAPGRHLWLAVQVWDMLHLFSYACIELLLLLTVFFYAFSF